MKILTAAQIRELDQATIREQRTTSTELMERAATAVAGWLLRHYDPHHTPDVLLMCGPGNNGGDGLALARLLYQAGYPVRLALLPAARYSDDYQHNHHVLPKVIPIQELGPESMPDIRPETLVVDALFGPASRARSPTRPPPWCSISITARRAWWPSTCPAACSPMRPSPTQPRR
jgi:hydroxyethylthiazole kinase-like uncharacterized protein yjeF